MNPQILESYETWSKAEDNIPADERAKGYKYRKAIASKLWNEFADLCRANGLHPVTVSGEIFVAKHNKGHQ